MTSPNGLQRLQSYNSSSSTSGASSRHSNQADYTSPSSASSPSHNQTGSTTPSSSSPEESVSQPGRMDVNETYIGNILGALQRNPNFGFYAFPEDLRAVFNKYVAEHPFEYTFNEMNLLLLYNAGGDDQFHEYSRPCTRSTGQNSPTSLSNEGHNSINTVSSPVNSSTESVDADPATPTEAEFENSPADNCDGDETSPDTWLYKTILFQTTQAISNQLVPRQVKTKITALIRVRTKPALLYRIQ